MLNPLPDLIDPREACRIGRVFAGEAAIMRFTRLLPSLHHAEGVVTYRVEFQRDASRIDTLLAEVCASLTVVCQRCLQPMRVPIQDQVRLTLVDGIDEAGLLSEDQEPWLLETPLINPWDIVEDELLLALPAFPRHDDGECATRTDAAEAAKSSAADLQRPFADLRQWLNS